MSTATLANRPAATQLMIRLSTSVLGRNQLVNLAGRAPVRIKLAA